MGHCWLEYTFEDALSKVEGFKLHGSALSCVNACTGWSRIDFSVRGKTILTGPDDIYKNRRNLTEK